DASIAVGTLYTSRVMHHWSSACSMAHTSSDYHHACVVLVFFFSSRRRHTRSVSAFLLNRSSDLLLLGKIGVFHNRRNASSRLLLLISKHLILCIYLVFRILA